MSDQEEQLQGAEEDREASSSSTSSSSEEDNLEENNTTDTKSSGKEKDQLDQMEEGESDELWKDAVQPLCMAFDSIRYSVKVPAAGSLRERIGRIRERKNPFKKIDKEILHPMSGHFL